MSDQESASFRLDVEAELDVKRQIEPGASELESMTVFGVRPWALTTSAWSIPPGCAQGCLGIQHDWPAPF